MHHLLKKPFPKNTGNFNTLIIIVNLKSQNILIFPLHFKIDIQSHKNCNQNYMEFKQNS